MNSAFVFPQLWWKFRLGIEEDADRPVIPEYVAAKLAQISSHAESGPGDASTRTALPSDRVALLQTSSRGHWATLRKRLRFAVVITKQISSADGARTHQESRYDAVNDFPPYVRNPDSGFSAVWDGLQIVFLGYVSLLIPLRTCFELEVEMLSAEFFVDAVVDVYFITDLLINFRTATYDANGVREDRPKYIARNYMRGWVRTCDYSDQRERMLSVLPFKLLPEHVLFSLLTSVVLAVLHRLRCVHSCELHHNDRFGR